MRNQFGGFMANSWGRRFLANCRATMTPVVADIKSLEADIRRRAQGLFDERIDTLPDEKGRMILVMCSLVLAAYEEAVKRVDQPQAAFDFVRTAFGRTYAAPLCWTIRIWLSIFRDPVRMLQKRDLAKQGSRMYGKSMDFAEEKTDDSAALVVTRCAFHQFFIDHGHPELTVLICDWDRNWMDIIDRSSRPVRTERTSTISTGGDCCRFRFVRDADKSNGRPDDVVLVQLERTLS